MIPFFVLLISTLVLRAIGAAGVHPLENWVLCLRGGLAIMFLVTGLAHWGRLRAEMIAMVPSGFPNRALMVSVTGVLEILGAVGLLIPRTATVAAACLAVLLIAMFPANVRAAREGLTLGGKPVMALPGRTLLQVIFIGAAIAAGWPERLA